MPITLFLCFPKEREEDRKGRGPPALSTGGLPHAPRWARGSAVCHLHSPPPAGRTPVFKKRTRPEPPRLAVGRRSSCLVSELHVMRIQDPVSSRRPSCSHRSGVGGTAVRVTWSLSALRGRGVYSPLIQAASFPETVYISPVKKLRAESVLGARPRSE